jgi:hypothetical protein
MRQREEARSAADTARASSREQAFALERERNELLRGETEQRERTERELARLRRERDSAVRQRDTLRERADVLLERQQHLLEDLSRPASSSSCFLCSTEPSIQTIWSGKHRAAISSTQFLRIMFVVGHSFPLDMFFLSYVLIDLAYTRHD